MSLIEEAAEAIRGAWAERAESGRVSDLSACAATAALAAFEKVHAKDLAMSPGLVINPADSFNVSPTDDEREALNTLYWTHPDGHTTGLSPDAIDALLPFLRSRRSEVPEPSAAADSWIPHARRALHIHDTWGTPDDPDGKVRSMSDYTELSARMANALRASLAVTEQKAEPQGEPSDAQVLAALNEYESWSAEESLEMWGSDQAERMRAALRAAAGAS